MKKNNREYKQNNKNNKHKKHKRTVSQLKKNLK